MLDGTVRCWGSNASGQLGNGTTTDSTSPITVSMITNAIAISAGGAHTCALLSDGTVACWGFNFSGQLGSGSNVDSVLPVLVQF
jgi:alpha-tubulin suppressor-like RCC1 family protein